MKFSYFPFLLLSLIMIFSCTSQSNNNPDVTNSYILITTAIKTSKESRINFQEKFATALDSFLVKDNPSINLKELNLLLEAAKKENIKAEAFIDGANEIDNILPYKARTYKMFKLLDTQYNTVYPDVLRIMESTSKNKKDSIAKIIIPAFNNLKILAKDAINTADSVVKKYNLKLVEIVNP